MLKAISKIALGADNIINTQISLNIWSNVYGLSRSLLALCTFLTLAFNDVYTLFKPIAGGTEQCFTCQGIINYSLFCLFPLGVAKWICLAILLAVIVGIYPRVTGLLHAWVCLSFISTAILVDGGDQVCTVLSVLLVPITITDGRRWHWSKFSPPQNSNTAFHLKKITAVSFYYLIRLQVALIYFEACVGKFKNTEWANGTAVYYWFTNKKFGFSQEVLSFFLPMLSNPVIVVLITWGALVLEGFLFAGLFIAKRHRKILLSAGILFHFLICLVHGLPTFFLAMTAALILFLRDPDDAFRFGKWNSLLQK
jgi:antimicrobial peptide system SdpB family protein